MINNFVIFTLSILLASCAPKKKERRIKVDDVTDYREVLFGGGDSLPVFPLSTKRHLLESLKANNYWFDESYGRELKWFNLNLNSRSLKVGVYKHYPLPGVSPRDVLQVALSRGNQLILEMNYIDSTEKADSLLYLKLSKTDFRLHEYLIFQWDERSSLLSVDSVFKEIEYGYTLFYDSIARNKYKSSIHNLKINELNEIKREYAFKVIVLVKTRPTQFGKNDKGSFFQGFYYE